MGITKVNGKKSSLPIDSSIYPRCNRPVNERNWRVIFASEHEHSAPAIWSNKISFRPLQDVAQNYLREEGFIDVDKSICN
jgi:hypothetical protein